MTGQCARDSQRELIKRRTPLEGWRWERAFAKVSVAKEAQWHSETWQEIHIEETKSLWIVGNVGDGVNSEVVQRVFVGRFGVLLGKL